MPIEINDPIPESVLMESDGGTVAIGEVAVSTVAIVEALDSIAITDSATKVTITETASTVAINQEDNIVTVSSSGQTGAQGIQGLSGTGDLTYVGVGVSATDTAALDAIIDAIAVDTPTVIQIRGDVNYDLQSLDPRKSIIFDGGNRQGHLILSTVAEFRTDLRQTVNSGSYLRGREFFDTAVVAGVDSYTHTDMIALLAPGGNWENMAVGDYVQFSGAIDERCINSTPDSSGHYGEPQKILSIDRATGTLQFYGLFREHVPLDSGNIGITWTPPLRNCGFRGLRITGPTGDWAARFVDCQDFVLENCDITDADMAIVYSSFSGRIENNKSTDLVAHAGAGVRIYYGCGDITVAHNEIKSTGNATDVSGGHGYGHHKGILFDSNKLYQHTESSVGGMRSHASGGATWRNNYLESRNFGSQGYGALAASVHCHYEYNTIRHLPSDETKGGIYLQCSECSAVGNTIYSCAGILAGASYARQADGVRIKGNTCIRESTTVGGNGISIIGSANEVFAINSIIENNTCIGFTNGLRLYNSGASLTDANTNRLVQNTLIDCTNSEAVTVGTPTAPAFQVNIVGAGVREISFNGTTWEIVWT